MTRDSHAGDPSSVVHEDAGIDPQDIADEYESLSWDEIEQRFAASAEAHLVVHPLARAWVWCDENLVPVSHEAEVPNFDVIIDSPWSAPADWSTD